MKIVNNITMESSAMKDVGGKFRVGHYNNTDIYPTTTMAPALITVPLYLQIMMSADRSGAIQNP